MTSLNRNRTFTRIGMAGAIAVGVLMSLVTTALAASSGLQIVQRIPGAPANAIIPVTVTSAGAVPVGGCPVGQVSDGTNCIQFAPVVANAAFNDYVQWSIDPLTFHTTENQVQIVITGPGLMSGASVIPPAAVVPALVVKAGAGNTQLMIKIPNLASGLYKYQVQYSTAGGGASHTVDPFVDVVVPATSPGSLLVLMLVLGLTGVFFIRRRALSRLA